MTTAAHAIAWLFLVFLAATHLIQLGVHFVALGPLKRKVTLRAIQDLPSAYKGFEPPISLVVAALDQESTIADMVQGLLQLDYPEFEIVVVNDGSTDGTLAALEDAFDLEPFPEVYWRRLATRQVRAIYRSRTHPRVRVIDKDNGGRGDALNAAINASRYPLFCAVDARALLHRDSLRRAAEPFVDDPFTVASGAAIRLANGCSIAGNRVVGVELPRGMLGLLQVSEYLRTYPFARLGWAEMRGALVMSGALAIFRKDAVVEAGGFKSQTLGAATELMMRLHRLLSGRGEQYSVHFVPDAVSWTIAPETFAALARMHIGRHGGLAASLHANAQLLGSRGAEGMIAYAYLVVFECYGPLVEIAGYAFVLAMFAFGLLPGGFLAAYLAASFALGFMVSASALLLEEYSFRQYPRADQVARLIMGAFIENLGYRQLVAFWRSVGLARWARSKIMASPEELRVPGSDRPQL